MADRRDFIENLRRKEFGLGVDFDPEVSNLLQVSQSEFCIISNL